MDNNQFSTEAFSEIVYGMAKNPGIKAVGTVLLTLLSYFWGDGSALIPIVALFTLDTVTGLMKAGQQNKISSDGWGRVTRKLTVYAIMMATAKIVDSQLNQHLELFGLTVSAPFLVAMQYFLIIQESISILENIAIMGWPVPTSIVKKLKIMQEKLVQEEPVDSDDLSSK